MKTIMWDSRGERKEIAAEVFQSEVHALGAVLMEQPLARLNVVPSVTAPALHVALE